MANKRRGEVDCAIGGRVFTLRLTLGALAEIEDALSAGSLSALGQRFGEGGLRASDLIGLLTAALNGAGADLAREDVARLVTAQDLAAVADALARLFALNFGAAPAHPPKARRRKRPSRRSPSTS
jgi:Phage tail tube protein, GTA-gp10